MGDLTQSELRRVEQKYAGGIGSSAVVEIFQQKGHRFSEATLRKYVQLGLLPKSRRVGTRGRHRGSSGLYPVSIVRLIHDIKQALDHGATLEEVRYGTVALASEVDTLARTSSEVLGRFEEAIGRQEDKKRQVALRRATAQSKKALERQLKQLYKLATQVARRNGVRG